MLYSLFTPLLRVLLLMFALSSLHKKRRMHNHSLNTTLSYIYITATCFSYVKIVPKHVSYIYIYINIYINTTLSYIYITATCFGYV